MSGGVTRPDECALMRVALEHGKIPAEAWPTLGKRGLYILEKWEGRGWWDSGVSTRSGWLTPAGREALPRMLAEAERRSGVVA